MPTLFLMVEILASLFPTINHQSSMLARPKICVLIPAHNESQGIVPTLCSVKSQIIKGDKVVVVADNCSDDTAQIARDLAVEVTERFDETKLGKGYALDYGIRYIEKLQIQPDVLIIVDADCVLGDMSLSRLAHEVVDQGRPMQALYIMNSSSNPCLRSKVAEFAWVVKNWVRPLGLMRLGMPCQLMGTGMAFPWSVIQKLEIASGHIVEDLKLGLDLALINVAPQFCPQAKVFSLFPSNKQGVNTQRTRWEHGHLAMLLKHGPNLIWQSLKLKNRASLVLALDMCIPPLALLVLVLFLLSILGLIAMIFSHTLLPWISPILLLITIIICIIFAWSRFARNILTLADLAYAPFYIILKIPVYMKFIMNRQIEWVRSQRDS